MKLPTEPYPDIEEAKTDAEDEARERIKALSLREKLELADPELLKEAFIKTVQSWFADRFKCDMVTNLDIPLVKSFNKSFGIRFTFSTVDLAEFDWSDIEEEIYQRGL